MAFCRVDFLETVLARVSTDIIKGIIATGSGFLASAFVAASIGTAVIAVAPILAGIAIAVAISLTLNELDKAFGVTEALANRLAEAKEDWLIATSQTRSEFNFYFGTSEGALEFMRRFPGNRRRW